MIEGGGTIAQQTRLFDANKGVTRSMRSKEEAHDYRYFPDPDLLPVNLSEEFVEEIRRTLPELPDDKKRRLVDKLGLSGYDADVLVAERATAEYFEAAAEGQDAKTVANWVTSDLFGYLNKEDLDIADSLVAAKQLGALVGLISDGTISGRIARDVFTEMCATSKDPAVVVEEKGLKQISDSGELEGIVDEAIAKGPAQVEQYKSGNEKIIGWFVGQVMQATKGEANPQMVNEILRKKLSE